MIQETIGNGGSNKDNKLFGELKKKTGNGIREALDIDDLKEIEISQQPEMDSLFDGFLNSSFTYREGKPIEFDLISMGYFKIVQIEAISKKKSFMLLHHEKDTGWVDTGWRWMKTWVSYKVFDGMSQNDLVSCNALNALIDGYLKVGEIVWNPRMII